MMHALRGAYFGALFDLLAGCAGSADDSGGDGWPVRLVSEGGLFTIYGGTPECTDVVAVILRDEGEWSAAVEQWLPGMGSYLEPSLVDWMREDAILGFTDCTFVGLSLRLEVLNGAYDGVVHAAYQLDIPQTVQDSEGRTYAIHAFAECGGCELTSVVTDR